MSTVTYTNPVATAPTVAQALLSNTIAASVVFGDADTTATVVHNFNLSAAQLALGFPIVSYNFLIAGTLAVNYSVAVGATNVVIAKASTSTGSGSTLAVSIARPWSALQ